VINNKRQGIKKKLLQEALLIRLSSTGRRIRHVLFGNVLIQGCYGRTITVMGEISIKIKERVNFL
jgi:hypothetical protein